MPVLLFIRFDAEIIVFDGCILFIRHCVDIKEVKRFNERDELFEAEVTDIKVGKLLIQKIAESPRKNPPVFIRIFFGQLDERLFYSG